MDMHGFHDYGQIDGTDVIRQAIGDVLGADVISNETKRGVLARLAVLKTSLNCPEGACRTCIARVECERLVEGILAST